jgi:hypothetical protein
LVGRYDAVEGDCDAIIFNPIASTMETKAFAADKKDVRLCWLEV